MAAKKPIKKTTSTGSPTLDAANAAKNFKAPKDYKPLTTAQKVAMAASVLPAGRAAKVAGKVASKVTGKAANKVAKAINKGTEGNKIADGGYMVDKYYHGGTQSIKNAITARKVTNIRAKEIKKSYTESAQANARGLKAANKPTRASKNPDTAAVKKLAESNRQLGQKEPYATRNAQERVDILNAHFGKAKGYKGNSTSPKKAILKKKSK